MTNISSEYSIVYDPYHRKTFQGINFQELLYADDTLIIAKNAKTANDYLHLIEKESEYLHLKLNHGKCSYISFNGHRGHIRFRNGENMSSTQEAIYLGAAITEKADPKHEIYRRISNTMPVLKRLDIFWNKTSCNRKWKMLVYNAVITTKILYGLESLEPTDSTGRLLDTFQLKGLRKILKLHTTFINRANTNEFVFQKANEAVGSTSVGPNRKIKPLTEILASKRLKLLGHVLRRERRHPLHQVTFASNRAIPRTPNIRRVGRPRKCWTLENMARAWDILRTQDAHHAQIPFDRNNKFVTS